MEYYNSAPKTEINLAKKTETEDVFNRQKLEFERLRSDVQIKLKFLDENRVNCIKTQPTSQYASRVVKDSNGILLPKLF